MNPNADIFRSVYDEPSALPSGDHVKSEVPPQSAGDGQLRTFAQTAGANFQSMFSTHCDETTRDLFHLISFVVIALFNNFLHFCY